MPGSAPAIAIVHDWFTQPGGAEKVVAELVHICPHSEIFTIFNLTAGGIADVVGDRPVHASYLNSLPWVRHYYRHLLLFAMREVERFDLSRFDIVLSSSAAIAKGVITRPGQKHIAYIHSPARYAWDLRHDYLSCHRMRGLRGMVAREVLHQFRNWDVHTTNDVDLLVANSKFVQQRIWKIYRRRAKVIYPPVDLSSFCTQRSAPRHFITASRLVDYKRLDIIIDAFAARPDLKLVVVGEGPEMRTLKQRATPNIEILGRVTPEELRRLYAEARAFVFAALEDFGIAPVEAQAAGLPVIALSRGGTAETIVADRSGVHFDRQTPQSLLDAMSHFESIEHRLTPENCRANAARFGSDTFRTRMQALIYHG